MAMLTIDGVAISPDPSSMKWSRMAVNAADAGRDQSGKMHTNVVCYKRKLECSWTIVKEGAASAILSAVAPEYITVSAFDPLEDRMVSMRCYVGDQEATFRSWQVDCVGGTTFKTISFNFIEV